MRDSSASNKAQWVTKLAIAALGVIALVAFNSTCRSTRFSMTSSKVQAPASPLKLGDAGRLGGALYRVITHRLTEIGQVGNRFDRHEYDLATDDGTSALFVQGSKPGEKDWVFLKPVQPSEPMTPQQAGARRRGDLVKLDHRIATVTDLFLSKVLQSEKVDRTTNTGGPIHYGFTAQSGTNLFIVRWNQAGIAFYCGSVVSAKAAKAAFTDKSGK